MPKSIQPKPPDGWPVLTKIWGSSYCQFSTVENRLVTLYENQEKILAALRMIYEQGRVR